VDKQTFILKSANRKSENSWASSATANPQIPWLGQCSNPKSANFDFSSANRKIRKFLQNFAQLSLKTVLKFVFLLDFLLCKNFNNNIMHVCTVFAELICGPPTFDI
jgi:hypothetical protein